MKEKTLSDFRETYDNGVDKGAIYEESHVKDAVKKLRRKIENLAFGYGVSSSGHIIELTDFIIPNVFGKELTE